MALRAGGVAATFREAHLALAAARRGGASGAGGGTATFSGGASGAGGGAATFLGGASGAGGVATMFSGGASGAGGSAVTFWEAHLAACAAAAAIQRREGDTSTLSKRRDTMRGGN